MSARRILTLLFALALSSAPLFARQTYVFDKLTVGTGSHPVAVATGDFNRDGRLDIVTVNQQGNSVSVLLGAADGTFATKVDYAVGTLPSAVVTGDFNGDGKLDLAVSNATSGTVSILLGNGNGTFKAQATYATGKTPQWLAVADLNGDGKLDLVTANSGANTISVLLGKGDGSFAAHADFATGNSPVSLTLGDFNKDGKLDAAVANKQASTVSILLGNGAGGFGAHTDFAAGKSPVSIAAADLNRDGRLDLVVSQNFGKNQTAYAGVLLGNGDGTFQSVVSYQTGPQPGQVITADVNGDGKPDVLIAAVNTTQPVASLLPGGISVLLGNGDGTLRTQAAYTTGDGATGLALGDFNRDGTLDVVTANSTQDSAAVLIGTGGGRFTTTTVVSGTAGAGIGVGDFNRDGLPDLITSDGLSKMSPFFNLGNGSFRSGAAFLGGSTPTVFAVGDFTGDGNPDLAVIAANNNGIGSILIFRSNADGSFNQVAGYVAGFITTSIVAADLNHDGILDLAYANLDDFNIAVRFGNGDGSFQAATNYATLGFQVQPVNLVAADFNNDGSPDLAYTNNFEGYLSVILNDGTGHFGTETHFNTGQGYAIAAGDLNHDGNMDLITGSNGGSGIFVLLGNGDGTFQKNVSYSTDDFSSVSSVSVADVDGDGIADVLAANANYVSLLTGKGDGTLNPATFYLLIRPSTVQAIVADITSASALDVANTGTQGSSILRNTPVIALDPNPLNFGAVTVGTSQSATITIYSSGVASLSLQSLSLGGVNAGDFTQTNTCAGSVLPGGGKCTVTVTFTPQAKSARGATLSIATTVQAQPYVVSLSGSGK